METATKFIAAWAPMVVILGVVFRRLGRKHGRQIALVNEAIEATRELTVELRRAAAGRQSARI